MVNAKTFSFHHVFIFLYDLVLYSINDLIIFSPANFEKHRKVLIDTLPGFNLHQARCKLKSCKMLQNYLRLFQNLLFEQKNNNHRFFYNYKLTTDKTQNYRCNKCYTCNYNGYYFCINIKTVNNEYNRIN